MAGNDKNKVSTHILQNHHYKFWENDMKYLTTFSNCNNGIPQLDAWIFFSLNTQFDPFLIYNSNYLSINFTGYQIYCHFLFS